MTILIPGAITANMPGATAVISRSPAAATPAGHADSARGMRDAPGEHMQNTLRILLGSALLLPACYVGETDGVAVASVSANGNADLVEIQPGVEVVADYGVPIFFADDFYWRLDGGIWYQSTWYGGGWYRAAHVSPRVAGIGHPERYTHYRPARSRGAIAHAVRSRPAPHGGRRR
jgi:hypothetical protein